MKAKTGKRRKQLRLNQYDYSQPGTYFVTICTKDWEHRFGEIVEGEMEANDLAAAVRSCWSDLPKHYQNVELDAFVIMPNHVHGIIVILDEPMVGARHASPLQGKRNKLGDIIGSFKSAVTKRVNEICNTPGAPFWQRGYYSHIVRDDRSLTRIREYIVHNPKRWATDKDNVKCKGNDDFGSWMASTGSPSICEGSR